MDESHYYDVLDYIRQNPECTWADIMRMGNLDPVLETTELMRIIDRLLLDQRIAVRITERGRGNYQRFYRSM